MSSDGIAVDDNKVRAVKGFPQPSYIVELRRFFGMTSFYSRYISGYSDIAKPLYCLTEKGMKFSWNDSCNIAFNTLKKCLIEAPVLCFPDFTKPFVLTTDASNVGLGAILSQHCDDGQRVIAYASRRLTKAERQYSATERECLGVVWGVEQFKVYLYGRQFELCTDYNPLVWLRSCHEPKGRLMRWILTLEEYDYQMCYRPGKSIPHFDA